MGEKGRPECLEQWYETHADRLVSLSQHKRVAIGWCATLNQSVTQGNRPP